LGGARGRRAIGLAGCSDAAAAAAGLPAAPSDAESQLPDAVPAGFRPPEVGGERGNDDGGRLVLPSRRSDSNARESAAVSGGLDRGFDLALKAAAAAVEVAFGSPKAGLDDADGWRLSSLAGAARELTLREDEQASKDKEVDVPAVFPVDSCPADAFPALFEPSPTGPGLPGSGAA